MMGRKYRLVVSVAALVVALDQLTKWLIQEWMALYDSLPVVEGIFHLTYIRNSGGAFGVLAGGPAYFRLPFFIVVSLVAIVVLAWFLRGLPSERTSVVAACGAVLGGAVGNLIDRLAFGEVVDFLDVFYRDHHWPTFNIADSFITVGVIVMVVDTIWRSNAHGQPDCS